MGSPNKKRGTLSDKERAEIIEQYKSGEYTYKELADKYKINKSTVGRICKGQKKFKKSVKDSPAPEPKTKPAPSPGLPVQRIDDDPIAFRACKLVEISDDIQATRDRGSFHSLPQFHRLHLQVHDEYIQMKREVEELDGLTDPNEVLHQIAIAVSGLPPLLKDRLMDILEGDYSNVIPLSGGE